MDIELIKNLKKLKSSLTFRIFWITTSLLTLVCFLTYAFIALAMPISYNEQYNQKKEQDFYVLCRDLEYIPLEEWGPLIDQFILDNEVNVVLLDSEGQQVEIPGQSIRMATSGKHWVIVETTVMTNTNLGEEIVLREGSAVAQDRETNWHVSVTDTEGLIEAGEMGTWEYVWSKVSEFFGRAMTVDSSAFSTMVGSMWEMQIVPAGKEEVYQLMASAAYQPVNQAVEAMGRILPWLAVGILCMSVAGALIYSRYITKPVVALNGVSKKMAALDFSWKCDDTRSDEIGELARSFNDLSGKLSSALEQLRQANQSLREDIDRERELERQQMMFFSALSHELKTPITVIKGQMEGMIGNVGAYRDRDKYLAKSLETACRMEGMVQEMLTISRMETGKEIQKQELRLDKLLKEQILHFADLAEQKNISLQVRAEEEITVCGEKTLLKKAVGNLLSNAVMYSPEGERVFAAVCMRGNVPVLMVENTGVNIPEDSLPHLFEPFYRVEQSRNRRTGGTGLGLYLVKTILERTGGACTIENTAGGVLVTVTFEGESTTPSPDGV